MFARSKEIILPYGQPVRTPILALSFSSKGFPELPKIMKHLSEYVSGPMLISAYDIEHSKIKRIPFCPELLFIDSGGYECSNIIDFIEYDKDYCKHKPWNERLHEEVIKTALLKDNINKVIVSYDYPFRRKLIQKQIESANELFEKLKKTKKFFLREIIIKPETKNKKDRYIPIDIVIENIKKFGSFDIIGFTEKELGESLLKIMLNICKISQALASNNMKQLIHIFGSLDPISTPLYFMCGTDIFDGLTWLRYSFSQGKTIYQQNYWFENCPLDSENFALHLRTGADNFHYLRNLYEQMLVFQRNKDFASFQHHSDLFRRIWNIVETHLEGGG